VGEPVLQSGTHRHCLRSASVRANETETENAIENENAIESENENAIENAIESEGVVA